MKRTTAFLLGYISGNAIPLDKLLELMEKISDTQECKHSGRLGDREEKEGGGGQTERKEK